MHDPISERTSALIVTVGTYACAIPLQHVSETMRPLSIEPVGGTPEFIRGVSVIRGAPIPVVDLHALVEGGEARATFGRFVTVKVGTRQVALAVDGVVGVMQLDDARLAELPPLLRHCKTDLIEAMGTSDAQLLLVLRAACIVPAEVWVTVAAATVAG